MPRFHDTYDHPNASARLLDENSALLSASKVEVPVKATPLPLLQLLILAAVRVAEPISYTQVSFSYHTQVKQADWSPRVL